MKKINSLILVLILTLSFQTQTAYAGSLGDAIIKLGKFLKGTPNKGTTTPPPNKKNNLPAVGSNGGVLDPGTKITIHNFEGTIATKIKPIAGLQGLDSFTRAVSDVLMRTVKAAAIIVAPAGTGKTVLANHLVHMIETKNKAVRNLHDHSVYNLDIKAIIGDTKFSGELEKKLVEFRQLLDQLKDKKIVFVADELEEVLGSELGKKFLTDLKPYFTQEMGVKFIFNITPGPYNELMTDPQLVRRMFKLVKEEPDDFIVKNILRHMKNSIYKKHSIKLTSEDLERIFKLSKKHPELKNPDVAVTILGDAVLKAVADVTSGDARIVALKTEIEKIKGTIKEINIGRQENVAKYEGPFFNDELSRLKEKVGLNEKIIQSYDKSFEATEILRVDMLGKIEKRSNLYQETIRKQDVDDLGGVDPEIEINQLSKEIDNLAKQIREKNKLLTAGEVKDNHIIDAAAAVLGKDKAYVREVMFGGQTVENFTDIVAKKVRLTKEAIEIIVRRVLTKDKIHTGTKKPQHFIIVSDDSNVVHEFADVFAKKLTGVPPLNIAGSSIKTPSDITSVVGSTAGYIGSNTEGVLHAYQKETAGNMVVYVSDLNQADKSLHDVLSEVVLKGESRSNSNRVVNFEDTVIVSSVKGFPPLTTEQKIKLNSLKSEVQKQNLYKEILKEKFTDGNMFNDVRSTKIDDALLETAHIIYAQADKLSQGNIKSIVVNYLKSTSLQRVFNNKLQMDVYFSDELVDYLFDIVKQVGPTQIDNVLENDLMPELVRLLEKGRIVAGDQVTITIKNGVFEATPTPWLDPVQREIAIKVSQENRRRVVNAGQSTDEVDGALEDMIKFLN